MRILESNFGRTPKGDMATLYSLQNSNGMIVNITNYGGIVTEIYVPDRNGKFENVCLGFTSMEAYQENPAYLGALIGRYANRINNGKFKFKETIFQLSKNDGANHLHGGHSGFDKHLWDAQHFCTSSTATLELHYLSINGEEGYPGNCKVTAIYELNNANEITLRFQAECDQATPINLTQHSYFNLRGSGDILGHQVKINAQHFCPINTDHIPTGEIFEVNNTPLDLREPKTLRELINLDHNQLKIGKGFNHYFFIDKNPYYHRATLNLATSIFDPDSGRALEIYTREPGVVFYSSGFLNSLSGYASHSGLCIEPQHCPNSINNPLLPSTILQPGNIYTSETHYRFLTIY